MSLRALAPHELDELPTEARLQIANAVAAVRFSMARRAR
jgi:hypothetical protein